MSRIFISHADRDLAWAEWARWHLEAAGYPTEIGSIDWLVGTNRIEAMNAALAPENPMLVLLSTAYLDSDRLATAEWTARLAQRRSDPNAKLIPLRIDSVDLHAGIWAPILVPDLFGLAPDQAGKILVDAVRTVIDPAAGRAGTITRPGYPGAPAATAADTGPRPPGSLPRVWNLARRNLAFTGRDAMLNSLHDTLRSGQRAAVQALHGMGGVGKTQLAIEYAHRFAGEYDLVWWVPSEQPELIGDHLVTLAVEMGLVPGGTPTPDAVKQLHAHLRGHSRWLLIFDNAGSRDDLTPSLPDGPGHLIITSRNPAWIGVAQSVDVDVFARSESTDLLRTHRPSLGADEAEDLAEALGDLPLAIEQAAGLLAETRLSPAVFLAELQTHAAELLRDGRSPTGYPRAGQRGSHGQSCPPPTGTRKRSPSHDHLRRARPSADGSPGVRRVYLVSDFRARSRVANTVSVPPFSQWGSGSGWPGAGDHSHHTFCHGSSMRPSVVSP
ncbi:TIR domain-containing protein [Actinoplanes sp. NPDC026619]|uniref:tetratricopeptide repeat protein n=1 Tax=Actinoplanes sp. NPDC026619 TaxID=3155798 RepID=UPI003405DF30